MSDHEQNVGVLDAAARVIAGIPIVVAGPVGAAQLAPDWGAVVIPLAFMVGGMLILSGSLRIDPVYSMFGLSTSRRAK